ncbi:GntR family transcriptional regulator [Achromobacter sp.]|uniref:GntR family transcriptional regulator n=1 Tax=Achromobacter sp. TaxID=134375 RepID=UPI0028AAB7B1|nr:GntR family transcriptional regulator [Achromobacter sp.]
MPDFSGSPGASADARPAVLRPLERETLWDRAYAALREALLNGRYAPGHRIVLREVAAELGISLTPVRDAVNRLIAERVLERGTGGQGGGATVPHLDANVFQQLVIMRAEIESRAAFEAVAHATDADVQTLRALHAGMAQLIDAEPRQGYLDVHRRFHFHLYALSGLDVIQDSIETLWLRCGPVLNMVLREYVPHLKATDHHAAAVEALAARDAPGVARAIRDDISEAGKYIHGLLLQDKGTH